jgi:hypothetical protein
VAVGAAPVWVDVGLGGDATELPPDGMVSSIPTLMIVLLIPLASMMACEVTPKRTAMLLKVSPAWTT